MASLVISTDPASIAKFRSYFAGMPATLRSAERDALNKSIAKAKTMAGRELAGTIAAPASAISKRIPLRRATSNRLEASFKVRPSSAVNISQLNVASQTSSGLSATVTGVPKDYPHAFFVRGVYSDKRLAVERHGIKGMPMKGRYAGRMLTRGERKGKQILRQSIRTVHTSLGKMVAESPPIQLDLTRFIAADLPKQLESQLDRYFPKK